MTATLDAITLARDAYLMRGWTPIPLALDTNGLPKRPIDTGWQHATPGTALSLSWDDAVGIGLSLGAASDGLGVIDIDDEELAAEVRALCERSPQGHYFVETARKRGHLYLVEEHPTAPTRFTVGYRGRFVMVELRTTGNQCAAPPSPGYTRVLQGEPMRVSSLRDAWNATAQALGLTVPPPARRTHGEAGYPRPWAERVAEGERNNAIYVEAHRLREAGLSEVQALEILTARTSLHYAQGLPEWEVRRTVISAYRSAREPSDWRQAAPEQLQHKGQPRWI